jgi:glycine dehydrogenase subunit 1
MPYAPATDADIRHMLEVVGAGSVDELFSDIPADLRFRDELDIPLGVSELELTAELGRLAARNVDASRQVSFLGYGSYDHHVPAVCGAITSRSEFATSYTPYQPEISQGTLQAIFEFQTAISELAGLPVANASLYDGATAAAEAMYLSEQTTRRSQAVVLRTVHAQVRETLRTYARAYGMDLVEVEYDPATGTTPVAAVAAAVGADTACVLVQQPNVFGALEDAPALVAAATAAGAVPVVSCDPLSLGLLEAPGAYGAGIVIGDGQALGNAQSFGGPAFGFMAAGEQFTRRMPGRIVGRTVDAEGRGAFVLTLQTREQHIRRDKATSNICTNQALNALSGIVYMSWLGPGGLERMGILLADRIEQVRARLEAVPGVSAAFEGPAFKELAVRLPIPAAEAISRCAEVGVHPGFDLGTDYPELGHDVLLVAVTEQRTDADIELLASALGQAVTA